MAEIACTRLRQHKKSGPRTLRQSKNKILKYQSAAFSTLSLSTTSGSRNVLPSSPPLSVSSTTSFTVDDHLLPTTYTTLASPSWDLSRIPLPILESVILLYNENLYGIWPLLQAEDLICQLEMDAGNAELYAVATALCGATLSYLDRTAKGNNYSTDTLTANTFVAESRRVRATFDYMEPVGLNTVLTSYFLHMHYGRQPGRGQMAAFYIREAITFAHLLGMHCESTYAYPSWSRREQVVMRRLYFLLFMTERYLCIQEGLPTVLESINLPEIVDSGEKYPDVVGSFLHLVSLFSTPGRAFFGMWTSNNSDANISRDQLLLIQQAIKQPFLDVGSIMHNLRSQCHDFSYAKAPCPSNPVQLVDIVVSQHWIRSLAWKLSVLCGYVSSIAGSTGAMSVAYPLEIAEDALRGIYGFPKDAFKAHGPGMEVKMCQIATSLADCLTCGPMETLLSGQQGRMACAKTVLRGLTDRILETQTMNPAIRETLLEKLDAVFKFSQMAPVMPLLEFEDIESHLNEVPVVLKL